MDGAGDRAGVATGKDRQTAGQLSGGREILCGGSERCAGVGIALRRDVFVSDEMKWIKTVLFVATVGDRRAF